MQISSITRRWPQPLEEQTWVVIGPKPALRYLSPLIEAQSRLRRVRVIESDTIDSSELGDAASLLFVGNPRRSPRTALPSIFLHAPDGRGIPVGWLPDAGARLADYATTAAEVVRRQSTDATRGPFVLLGGFEKRALDWVQWFLEKLPPDGGVYQWTAERIRRSDLLEALQNGAGAAFYFGHSTHHGWCGYGGVDAFSVIETRGHPIGCIISFSCLAAGRPRKGLSFCEEFVLSGLCSAAIGSTALSLHHRNVEWSLRLAETMSRCNAVTLADLLTQPSIPIAALNSYRILGDPMTPLIGHQDCRRQSQKVFAPAPNDERPVLSCPVTTPC